MADKVPLGIPAKSEQDAEKPAPKKLKKIVSKRDKQRRKTQILNRVRDLVIYAVIGCVAYFGYQYFQESKADGAGSSLSSVFQLDTSFTIIKKHMLPPQDIPGAVETTSFGVTLNKQTLPTPILICKGNTSGKNYFFVVDESFYRSAFLNLKLPKQDLLAFDYFESMSALENAKIPQAPTADKTANGDGKANDIITQFTDFFEQTLGSSSK